MRMVVRSKVALCPILSFAGASPGLGSMKRGLGRSGALDQKKGRVTCTHIE